MSPQPTGSMDNIPTWLVNFNPLPFRGKGNREAHTAATQLMQTVVANKVRTTTVLPVLPPQHACSFAGSRSPTSVQRNPNPSLRLVGGVCSTRQPTRTFCSLKNCRRMCLAA